MEIDLEAVIALLRRMAVDGIAPTARQYDAMRGKLPKVISLRRRGFGWGWLVQQAGLGQQMPGRPNGGGRRGRSFSAQELPGEVETWAQEAHESDQSGWVVRRPDGSVRTWYSTGGCWHSPTVEVIPTGVRTRRVTLGDGRVAVVQEEYFSIR
jgi:hypothetical protein